MLIPNSVNIVGKSNNTPSIFYYIDYMKKVLAKIASTFYAIGNCAKSTAPFISFGYSLD